MARHTVTSLLPFLISLFNSLWQRQAYMYTQFPMVLHGIIRSLSEQIQITRAGADDAKSLSG